MPNTNKEKALDIFIRAIKIKDYKMAIDFINDINKLSPKAPPIRPLIYAELLINFKNEQDKEAIELFKKELNI